MAAKQSANRRREIVARSHHSQEIWVQYLTKTVCNAELKYNIFIYDTNYIYLWYYY